MVVKGNALHRALVTVQALCVQADGVEWNTRVCKSGCACMCLLAICAVSLQAAGLCWPYQGACLGANSPQVNFLVLPSSDQHARGLAPNFDAVHGSLMPHELLCMQGQRTGSGGRSRFCRFRRRRQCKARNKRPDAPIACCAINIHAPIPRTYF